MNRYALLLGSAPENCRQKKLDDLQNFLLKGGWQVTAMPNGMNLLLLEYALNNILDDEPDEVLVYFCAKTSADLDARLSDAVLLGSEEIRRDVIAYYADLAKKYGIGFSVVYDSDEEFVSEESLGWESIGLFD